MQKGYQLDPRKSKDLFEWSRNFVHKFNIRRKPMRGGTRM